MRNNLVNNSSNNSDGYIFKSNNEYSTAGIQKAIQNAANPRNL